jgi:hypothetical protein
MPGSQQQQDSNASKYTPQLLELQKLLQVQQSSERSATDIAAADAEVTQLRQATAALKKMHDKSKSQPIDARQSISVTSNAQTCAAAAACLQALAQLLLSPPAELYCEPSGSPCQPPEGLELSGRLETYHETHCIALHTAPT